VESQVKVKLIPQQAELAQGVPGSSRPRIFLTFGTTRMVGRQPYASATFTPGEIPGTHFQRLSRPRGTWFRRKPRKKSPVTPPGIDFGTVRLVEQCLNHYATPVLKYIVDIKEKTTSSWMDSHGVLTECAGDTNRITVRNFFFRLRFTRLSEDFRLQYEA
jgi:hypothetical protein